MLSINTNLSSMIAQNSMKTSTAKLDQAIERMTTGAKLNHAKDNAANYSIATNMTTKMGALRVAEDNVFSSLDLVSTANEVITMMEDRASRLSALSIQARNGTNGARSLEALNAEAGAIVSEITRLYNSTQFNNVNLFNRTSFTLDENLPQAGKSGFIDETALISTTGFDESLIPTAKAEYGGFIENPYTYTDAEVAAMTALTDDVTTITSGEKYSISDLNELENLRVLVNSGVDTTGAIFVLGADIDLSSIANWTPIGTEDNQFKGEFDGNGNTIFNLTINGSNLNYRGLFGVSSENSSIKDLRLNNAKITARMAVGAIVSKSYGNISNVIVDNAYINANGYVGGITGRCYGSISNSYAIINIVGQDQIGGITAETYGLIKNSYSLGEIVCTDKNISIAGGLTARNYERVENCYSCVNIEGGNYIGGLIAGVYNSIINCYTCGNIEGGSYVGGLCATTTSNIDIKNCYATGNVSGTDYVGGGIGCASTYVNIVNCYATGNVSGDSEIGGLVGDLCDDAKIINCHATGNINGTTVRTGGLVGRCLGFVENCYATGNVRGFEKVGGLAGAVGYGYSVVNSYATGNVEGAIYTGGLVGMISDERYTVKNCYSLGKVVGDSYTGGLVGNAVGRIEDCYSSGNVYSTGEYAGGLIGRTNNSISGCYSTGSIQGANNVGGLVGYTSSEITTSYSTGDVSGESFVGGLVGQGYKVSGTTTYTGCHAYGKVSGTEGVGGLIGGSVLTTNGTNFGKINLVDCQAVKQNADSIGGVYQYDSATTTYTLLNSYDTSGMVAGIKEFTITPTRTSLLLGINSNDSDQIFFDTNFVFNFSPMLSSVDSEEFSQTVNSFVKQLQEKTTILGAVQNRLESALDEISIKYENLASSRSTIRDVDMAKVSSQYIQQQILQDASATLLSSTQNIQYQNVLGLLQSLSG